MVVEDWIPQGDVIPVQYYGEIKTEEFYGNIDTENYYGDLTDSL